MEGDDERQVAAELFRASEPSAKCDLTLRKVCGSDDMTVIEEQRTRFRRGLEEEAETIRQGLVDERVPDFCSSLQPWASQEWGQPPPQ